jgi:hypothetical protein
VGLHRYAIRINRMPGIFEEVGIRWDGVEYVVPADKVMGLVEVIEEIITLEELHNQSGMKRTKLARAFAAALAYAGCRNVGSEDVYTAMFGTSAGVTTANAVTAILSLMIPPEHIRQAGGEGKPKARSKSKGLSKRRIS